jgi:hypothetical protein
MANYLEIHGVFNLLNAASRMTSRGDALRGELADLMRDIEAAEQDPGTFPPDEFTEQFLKQYHEVQEDAGPANEAVRRFVAGVPGSEEEVGLGGVLSQFGSIATNAAWAYSSNDDEGARNINAVEA